jgi:pyrimidine operon attenuation protein/uracil phosphoribosyltransferase
MSSLTLDAEALYSDLLRGMRQQLASYPLQPKLVGVASGGAWLAQRLQKDLGLEGEAGVLSSSMHRDDFSQRGLASSGQTLLPFDVNGAHLVVVDDVLYTGRTTRAAINVLFDYGRPACIKLAALADRGGRELPVAPDYVGVTTTLADKQLLSLARDASGHLSLTIEDDNAETVQ